MAEEIHVNPQGGRQALITVAYHLFDPSAIEAMAQVLYYGAGKYGVDNWRLIPSIDHINHAMNHLFKHLAGDRNEDHLVHAFTRLMFAVAMNFQEEKEKNAG